MASVSVRQKLIALQKFEILYILLENELNEHTTEISEPNFDRLACT